jgi:hypothetical protein
MKLCSLWIAAAAFHQFLTLFTVLCSYQDLDAPEDEVTVMDYRSL